MARRRFTTDKHGNLPAGISLLPDTTYVARVPQRAAKRLQSNAELASWIEDCVLGDLRTLRLGMEVRQSMGSSREKHLGGGNFLLLAGCLMALEYFARIYKGFDDAVSCVRAYAHDFLAKVDPRYCDVCGILWRAARNGMVHGSWPLRVSLESEASVIRFGVGNEYSE